MLTGSVIKKVQRLNVQKRSWTAHKQLYSMTTPTQKASTSESVKGRFSRSRLNHGFRYLILAMPITAFALGTWQVQRRKWKLLLIEDAAQKLSQKPLTDFTEVLGLTKDSEFGGDAVPVKLKGHFVHDKEMLVGPRQRDGKTGYHLITPFCTEDKTCILVNRGWIEKRFAAQSTRPASVGQHAGTIFGLLKRKTPHNVFTPANDYTKSQFYFVDIKEMSKQAGVLPLLVEETVIPSYGTEDWEKLGIPVGSPHEVLLRNNHMQYIITWYAPDSSVEVFELT